MRFGTFLVIFYKESGNLTSSDSKSAVSSSSEAKSSSSSETENSSSSQAKSSSSNNEFDWSRSQKDALTGLYNRLFSENAVNKLIKAGHIGTVFMIDMDNFKAINDEYGHIAGDNVLKMMADTLRSASASNNDILCRIGGDEFIAFF